MKRVLFILLFLGFFLKVSACADAAWRLVLKNGGEFITPQYWQAGEEILFYTPFGTAGISKKSVAHIEKAVLEKREHRQTRNEEKTAAATSMPDDSVNEKVENAEDLKKDIKKEETGTINIAYYKEKKAQFETELKEALERVRAADIKNDAWAKEQAQRDAKEISAKMKELTAELIEKNKGKMPDEWWE